MVITIYYSPEQIMDFRSVRRVNSLKIPKLHIEVKYCEGQ